MTLLVLGGSTFMGKLLVESTRQLYPDITVVTLNRGNEYWGVTSRPDFTGDRNNREDYKSQISKITGIVAVVDFCGFKRKDISDSLPESLFQVPYIFISTDSVYECVSMHRRNGCVIESDSNLVCKALRKRDKYGYNKWKCEEALRSRCGSNLLILRLPDVLGEFDDTFRLARMAQEPTENELPDETDPTPLAFVYSGDVVRFVQRRLFEKGDDIPQTLNLVMDQQPTIKEFRALMAKFGPVSNRICFPSVEHRKCPLSNVAAKKCGFEPTPLEAVLEQVITWIRETNYANI